MQQPTKGDRFGRLTVLSCESTGPGTRQHRRRWYCECQCDCGQTKTVRADHLRSGRTVSCGCFHDAAPVTHGLYRAPEYTIWAGMIQRCTNPNNAEFHNYGARGIAVDSRWLSFECFISDMGRRPSPQHSIDRRDNDGPYSVNNCRWATTAEQNRNKRSNRMLTVGTRTMTITDWARSANISPITLSQRLRYGWDAERAVTTPAHGWPNPSL